MKTIKLKIDYTYDFALTGLISSAKNYKLAWDINRHLALHMVKKEDLIIQFEQDVSERHIHFSHESLLSTVKLFKNSSSSNEGGGVKKILVQEYPHVDYVLMMQGMDDSERFRLEENLRKVNTIEMIVPISLHTLKHKDFFIF